MNARYVSTVLGTCRAGMCCCALFACLSCICLLSEGHDDTAGEIASGINRKECAWSSGSVGLRLLDSFVSMANMIHWRIACSWILLFMCLKISFPAGCWGPHDVQWNHSVSCLRKVSRFYALLQAGGECITLDASTGSVSSSEAPRTAVRLSSTSAHQAWHACMSTNRRSVVFSVELFSVLSEESAKVVFSTAGWWGVHNV
jgi:hypothetical protein